MTSTGSSDGVSLQAMANKVSRNKSESTDTPTSFSANDLLFSLQLIGANLDYRVADEVELLHFPSGLI